MTKKLYFSFGAVLLVATITAFQAGRHFVVQPSAESRQDDQLVTVCYPVEDLVTPWKGAGSSDQPEFETLVTLVTATVAPGTWKDGRAVTAVPPNRILAVTHTDAVHRKISTLLAESRGPISYYDECLTQNVCMHCRTTPMPKVGNRCDKCNALRCEPRFDTPQIAAIHSSQR